MRAFILILVFGSTMGCGTSFTYIHNKQPVHQVSCGVGGYSCVVETNDQIYPTAQAKYGQMPGNLRDSFAVEEAVAVHQRTMNSQLYGGYWGYGAGWGGIYPPVTTFRFVQPPTRGYYAPSPMTVPIGPNY